MTRASFGSLSLVFLIPGLVSSCAPAPTGVESPPHPDPTPNQPHATEEQAPPSSLSDDGKGGRLFDRFFDPQTFSPDNKKTPGVADGKGGPLENGTLPLPSGAPLLNDAGHDFRLKNFFGWDLRGSEGIYGARYQNKSYVLPLNLLDETLSAQSFTELLTQGDDERAFPAYEGVLTKEEIDAIVRFVTDIRKGHLPHPDQIWTLSEGTPGNYRLNVGADAARGKQLYRDRCSSCHGSEGTAFLFDDGEFSLGTHARQKAYEDWFKILNGQPGTSMKRFVEGSGQEMGQQILDLLAALCDRTAFPKGAATSSDVPDGDPRCGDYLK